MPKNNRARQTAAVIQSPKQTSATTPSTAIEDKPSESSSPVNETNSSLNTLPQKAHVRDEQEEESAITESMDIDEDSSSSSRSNPLEAGTGMTDVNNIPNSNSDPGPKPTQSVFNEAYGINFVSDDGQPITLIQTGDGKAAVEGYNRAHGMNFKKFEYTSTGFASENGSGVEMKHFEKAHNLTFSGGCRLEFIGGKPVQVPISNPNPQPRPAPPPPNYQTQPYGYNQGYGQPPNMYPGPQANGWNNGPAFRDGRGGSPPLHVTQSITAYASYEGQMPGNRQQPFYPEQGGQWYAQNQYANAEQTTRPGQGAQYGNPPPNMNYGPPPSWNQYRQDYR